MAPLNSTETSKSNSFLQSNWINNIQSDPTKIILLASLLLHFILVLSILFLCFKYRILSKKFQKLKSSFSKELDDRKKETTKLHNYFNSTRPNTQSTSGAYFDDCYADQKLLDKTQGGPHSNKGMNS